MPDPPPDRDDDSWRGAPIDYEVLDRIGRRLGSNDRFSTVEYRPPYAPNSLVGEFDRRFYPAAVERAYLQVRWYENDDFAIHYVERYDDGDSWECRWDRHPNDHNSRGHFHPPPDAGTPGTDEAFPRDWREVIAGIIGDLDGRMRAFWE